MRSAANAPRPDKTAFVAIVREYFPDASEDVVGYILWNCTGYPDYFDLRNDANGPTRTVEDALREQLAAAQRGECEEFRRE